MSRTNYKTAPCPVCLPNGRGLYKKDSQFDENGKLVRAWYCTNCGHMRPLGKKPVRANKQQQILANIKKALDDYNKKPKLPRPVTFREYKEEVREDGSIVVSFNGFEGDENTMLASVTSRYLAMVVTPTGGLRVFYDSKTPDGATETEKKKRFTRLAKELRNGFIWYW